MSARWNLVVVLGVILVFGCTKKRDEKFVQGQGKDLIAITDMDKKTFDLKTSSSLGKANVSRATNVKISDSKNGINNFELVKYQTDAKLLGEVPLRGRENYNYKVRYQVTSKYLKVVKLGKKIDIPYQEYPYGQELESEEIAIPMVGYNIKGFYRIEKKLNENNQETNEFIEVEEKDISKATHFKIDYETRTVFEAVKKIDVFPSNLFDGEWYYSEVITGTPSEDLQSIGQNSSVDLSLRPSSKIKFNKTINGLRGVNISIDERLNQKDDINYSPVIEIPVAWIDYRAKPEGSTSGLKEEEIDANTPWEKRTYMQVAFEGLQTALFAGLPAKLNVTGAIKLVDLEIADNYIGLTVLRVSEGLRVKYSFLKAGQRQYQPRVFFKGDGKRFGIFTNSKEIIENYETYNEKDFEKNVFLTRFNPKNKEIVFYFTNPSPQNIRIVGQQAVDAWNETFKQAGTGITVRLDTSKDVDLGDLRYNTINLIDGLTSYSLLGFGPSITDPQTGEIISATSNIHVTPVKSNLIDDIRNYVRSKQGYFEGKNIIGAGGPSSFSDFTKGMFSYYQYDEKVPGKISLTSKIESKPRPTFDDEAFAISSKNIIAEIQEQCPYIDQNMIKLNSGSASSEFDLPLYEKCANTLLPAHVLPVVVHEMGHNFGLSHNFHASNDYENNFDQVSSQGEKIKLSSVMDYPSPILVELSRPGLYDLAAIRYSYTNKVEKTDGQIMDINPTRSIESQIDRDQIRPFKFCWDPDVSLMTDPLCAPFDAGTTPVQIVQNYINEFWAGYATNYFRYDRYDSVAFLRSMNPQRLAAYNIGRYLLPLKVIYDQWRLELAKYRGKNLGYLDDLSPEAYRTLLANMAKDKKEVYDLYRPAAEKIYEFIKTLIFLPNRYCVVKNGSELNVLELSNIRNEVFDITHSSVFSCKDAHVQSYLKSLKFELMSETGFEVNNTRNSQTIDDLKEPLDTVGIKMDRINALLMLTVRNSSSASNRFQNFYPNMLDEPIWRNEILNLVYKRIADGVVIPEVDPKNAFPRFAAEKGILGFLMMLTRSGLNIPGKESTNFESDLMFLVRSTTIEAQIPKNAVEPVLNIGGRFFWATKENKFALNLMQTYQNLVDARDTDPAKEEDFKELKEIVARMPEEKTNPTFKVSDFKALYDKLDKLSKQKIALESVKTFNEVQTYSLTLLKKFNTLYTALGNDKNAQKEFMEKDAVALTREAGFPVFPYYKENFETLGEEIKELIDSTATNRTEYLKNKLEYDAQIDLLVSIITGSQG